MPTQGVFVAIGHVPSTGVFKDVVELDEKGYVVKAHHKHMGGKIDSFITQTSIKGVFVAGDVHDYIYRQAITASGFGCMAAMDVLKYLEKDTPNW